jgi:hypothetical protein
MEGIGMALDEMFSHLDAIEEMLRKTTEKTKSGQELKEKKAQFRTIDHSIRQLSKRGIPVPEELKRMRDELTVEIDKLALPSKDIGEIYNRFLSLVEELGRLCGRSPRKDLYLKAKEKKKNETDIDTLAEALTTVLGKMGGSGKEKSIIQGVENALQNDLSKADLDRPYGKTPRWKTNLRKARKGLIEKGVLTPDSKGKTWTLAG